MQLTRFVVYFEGAHNFQYPNLGSWQCNFVRARAYGSSASSFQYPNLGSWQCNNCAIMQVENQPEAFSILTSDRGSATAPEQAPCGQPTHFQYPNLGSWQCNAAAPAQSEHAHRTFSILTSDRGSATLFVFVFVFVFACQLPPACVPLVAG